MNRRGRPPYPDVLTPREWEVLDLVERGYTNDEIASRLGISFAGAKFHVSEILGKLHLSSRDEAARWHRERFARAPFLATLFDWLRAGPHRVAATFSLGVLAVVLGGVTVLGVGIACADTRGGRIENSTVGTPLGGANRFVYVQDAAGGHRVATFDADRMSDVASFVVGTDGFTSPVLAADRVIVLRGNKIVSYALDGTDERTLREAPGGHVITRFAASPDARVLAVAEVSAQTGSCPWVNKETCYRFENAGRVVLIDLKSLETLKDIPHLTPGLDGLHGWVDSMTWFADSQALTLQTHLPVVYAADGTLFSGAPGGTAVVGTDGAASRLPLEDIAVSPNGRYGFTGAMYAPCEDGGYTVEAAIYDLEAGTAVASARDDTRLVVDRYWSPDGTELLYSTWAVAGEQRACSQGIRGTEEWSVLHADGSLRETGVDPAAIVERWYGDRLIKHSCPSQDDEFWFAEACAFGLLKTEFRGQAIGSAEWFEVLGWIE